jgi:hypothetical protein
LILEIYPRLSIDDSKFHHKCGIGIMGVLDDFRQPLSRSANSISATAAK